MRIRTEFKLPALFLGAGFLGVCLALAPLPVLQEQASAQDAAPSEPRQDGPGEMARDGLEQMMRALRLLVESIPQYELPEVLENGDIIIRRKHAQPNPGGSESKEPEFDETAT